MRYTVLHHGVPIGIVELSNRELAAGTMSPTDAYRSIRPTIQAGSEALLQLGFFGAGSRVDSTNPAPLAAAAALSFELADPDGRDVPVTFLNLIEAPGDERVVVLARLSHSPASIAAKLSPPHGAAPDASRPDA